MPKYAVEIGKLLLVSNEPISQERRTLAIKALRNMTGLEVELDDGSKIVVNPVRP
jgi:hypothetical protein